MNQEQIKQLAYVADYYRSIIKKEGDNIRELSEKIERLQSSEGNLAKYEQLLKLVLEGIPVEQS